MTGIRSVCISHGEDADGLTCASLLRRLNGARPLLATYDDLEDVLKSVVAPLDEVYICDLNVREGLVDEVIRIRGFAAVTLIDHHPPSEGILERLAEAGVTHFREELGRQAGRLAAYAAWADQFEDGPIATLLLREYDRQLVQNEGLILAHAVINRPTEEFRRLVIDALSALKFPHRVPEILEAATDQLEYKAALIEALGEVATKKGNIVAGLLLDAMGTYVGVCYVEKGSGLVNISLRSRRGFSFHLGEITNRIARNQGGFGGGHKRASGASIPQKGLEGFLRDFEEELRGQFN
jgi:oligoribonuclease NrnB/cAMP/cGMP phosphodiesterase (DHH superfamily)